MENKAIPKAIGKMGASLLLPAALFLLSPAWLERQPSLCLSQLLFKRSCPGCGITRALAWSLHGEFSKAWLYNKRVVVVLPLLVLVWMRTVVDGWRELQYAFVRHM